MTFTRTSALCLLKFIFPAKSSSDVGIYVLMPLLATVVAFLRPMSMWGNGMVLQSKTDDGRNGASVFGLAVSKAAVTLCLDQNQHCASVTSSDGEGFWTLPMDVPPGGPHTVTLTSGTTTETVSDVYFGDVFICSGIYHPLTASCTHPPRIE